MAFEQVFLRLADGRQFGPIPFAQLGQWHAEGRVPADAAIVDAVTGEAQPVSASPALVVPPPVGGYSAAPPAPSAPSGIDHLIPAKNPNALAAYYVSIASLLCCIPCGPIALVLGIKGLKAAPTIGVGKTHALVGIIVGGITTLAGVLIIIFSIVGIIASQGH
jgi:hypothetical protein